MNFYYRSLPEGQCEVVCTRCFLTLGSARDIEEIRRVESRHQCAPKRTDVVPFRPLPVASARRQEKIRVHSTARDRKSRWRRARHIFVLLLAALVLYALPTALEFAALRHSNPWVSTILPGDVAGCVCLALMFRKGKAGILLYCLLTVFEACAYGMHIMPLSVLVWFTDLVPTVVVSALMLRSAGSGAKLVAIS